ncbi:MAG: beta-ketoacyl synthase N-terminal-like domain-containing protein, partial [Burkholderiales bacterium]
MDRLEDRDCNGPDDLIGRLGWRGERQSGDAAFIFLADGKRETQRLTYGALERRARSVAVWVERNGLAGERIVLLYRPGLDFVVGFLACLYAGAIAVPAYPLNPRHPDPRLESILDDCAPAAAFCSEEDRDSLAHLLANRQLKVVATAAIPEVDANQRHRTIAHDAVAHLQYTSGSTGNPKGVMLTHGNLLQQCRYLAQVFGVGSQSVIVSWQPFFHDMGLVATLVGPVYWGARVVVMPPAVFLRSPISWLKAITEYRGTGAGAPNFAYELCVTRTTPAQREGLDLSSWECAVNGAEPIRADTLDRFCETFEPYGFRRRTFLPSYGMAETTLCATGSRVQLLPVVTAFRRERLEQGRAETCAADEPQAARLVSSGIVSGGGGVEIAIVDAESLQRQPENVIGEIWVSGPAVAKGYWRRPEETQTTFEARMLGEDAPYLRTGDLGFVREGELYVSGRLKDMVIIRGRNLYPQDIELVAQRSHPALEPDCCVAFALEVDGHEELGVAAEVKRAARREIDATEVVEAVRAAIRVQFGVAVHWVGLVQPGGVPKTSSGKVMRSGSRRLLHSGALPLLDQWRTGQNRDPMPFPPANDPGPPSAPLSASSCESGRRTAPGAEPIAIVGLACRFPGAADAEAFWQLLEEGRDAIREVPPERWDVDAYYDAAPGVPGKMNSRCGGFIEDMAGFDAAFFDISPREATSMDPQHRQLLEVSWLALEHAGIAPARLEGRAAGVFVGISTYDYKYILAEHSADGADAFMATGNAHSAAVGRLSFMLGLQGPCVAVDTACSSSLVAVHQAAQSLRLGECEVALAGGVNAVLRPEVNVAFAQTKLLSPKGRCRAFDAAADGYVRSEGCGMLVLKRVRDAQRDGDRVLAVIRGSAV